MYRLLKIILLYLIVLVNPVIGQVSAYVGGGFGVGRYNGEIGYNDYLFLVPLSLSSRPSINVLFGLELTKNIQLESVGQIQNYEGDNIYSSVRALQPLEAKVSGISYQLGAQILYQVNQNPYIKVGVGSYCLWNSYQTRGAWVGNFSENLNPSLGLGFIASYRMKKYNFHDKLELRYRFLYNLEDDFEGRALGEMGDNISEFQLVYTIPNRFIPLKLKNSPLPRFNRRSRGRCPTF